MGFAQAPSGEKIAKEKGQIDFVLEPAFCLSYATFTFINPSESVNCSPPVAFCSKGNGSGSIGHPSLELG